MPLVWIDDQIGLTRFVAASTTMTMPLVPVMLSPTILSVSLNPSSANIFVATQPSLCYALEYKNELDDADWRSILPAVPGDSGVLMLSDPNPPAVRRFYRIRAQ
jgi:hypothetical protein